MTTKKLAKLGKANYWDVHLKVSFFVSPIWQERASLCVCVDGQSKSQVYEKLEKLSKLSVIQPRADCNIAV